MIRVMIGSSQTEQQPQDSFTQLTSSQIKRIYQFCLFIGEENERTSYRKFKHVSYPSAENVKFNDWILVSRLANISMEKEPHRFLGRLIQVRPKNNMFFMRCIDNELHTWVNQSYYIIPDDVIQPLIDEIGIEKYGGDDEMTNYSCLSFTEKKRGFFIND